MPVSFAVLVALAIVVGLLDAEDVDFNIRSDSKSVGSSFRNLV